MITASQVREFQFDKGACLTLLALVRLWSLEVSKSSDKDVFPACASYTSIAAVYHINGTIIQQLPIRHLHLELGMTSQS
jgi:hypothetical protein